MAKDAKQFIIAFTGEDKKAGISALMTAVQNQSEIIKNTKKTILTTQKLDDEFAQIPDLICYCISPTTLLNLKTPDEKNNFLNDIFADENISLHLDKLVLVVNQPDPKAHIKQSQKQLHELLDALAKLTINNTTTLRHAVSATAINNIDDLLNKIIYPILEEKRKSKEKFDYQITQIGQFIASEKIPEIQSLQNIITQLITQQAHDEKIAPVYEALTNFTYALIDDYNQSRGKNVKPNQNKLTEIKAAAKRATRFYTETTTDLKDKTKEQIANLRDNFINNFKASEFGEKVIQYAIIFASTLAGIATGCIAGAALGFATGVLTIPITAAAGAIVGGSIGFGAGYSMKNLCDKHLLLPAKKEKQKYLLSAKQVANAAQTYFNGLKR